jgi:rhodanese-related sulfurtransferase
MKNFLYFIHSHLFLFSAWLILLFSIISFITQKLFSRAKLIDINHVMLFINDKSSIIIDVRSKKDFLKGFIPNSINIPLKEIYSYNLEKLNSFKTKNIIFVADDNIFLQDCIDIFYKNNFKKLFILKHGLKKWNVKKLPLICRK